MRGLKRDMWNVGIALAALLFLFLLMIWVPLSASAYEGTSGLAAPGTVQATPTEDATVTALNKEKLVHENDWWWSNGATILTSLISTLTLAAAGIFTVVRYFNDRRDAREKQEEEAKRLAEDRKAERERRDEEQQRWLKDQEVEREKRAEQRFQAVVEGLGSERTEAKVGAAIMLRTFLRPGYEEFYSQAFDLAVVHLRLRKADPSVPAQLDSDTPVPLDSFSQALITVFRESFPLARDSLKRKPQFDIQHLDASRIRLDNANLFYADLSGARMREAYLIETNLRAVDLSHAYLTMADLSHANLRKANLRAARLRKANLSHAHLDDADLREAYLGGANFSSTHFRGADLRGVRGLTKEQLAICKAEGAIIDEDITTSSSQSPVAPPAQSNDT